MIFALCLFIVVSSGFIGKQIAKKYVLKDKFYKELIEFTIKLKNNVNFKCLKLGEVFEEFINTSSFKQQFTTLKDVALNNKTGIKILNLSTEENKLLENFFKQLGGGDKSVELNNIECFLTSLSKLSNDAQEVRKKNESLIYKVSIAVGVVISILIV